MTTDTHSSPLSEVLKGVRVIDTDTHYQETPDLWTSRAPGPFRDRVPHQRMVDGKSIWFVEGDVFFGEMGPVVIDKNEDKARGYTYMPNMDEVTKAAYDPTARLELMDRLGIYAQILYPNAAGLSSVRFMVRVKDQELRTLCIQLYNDAVAEVQAQSDGRLFPMAMLPVWDREATLREVRRAKEDLHLRGVLMSDYPDGMGLPDYGDSYWDPFWELCNDLDLPMNFHIGGRGSKIDAEWGKTLPWASFGPQRSGVVQNTAFMMSNATTIANFVLSGLFDRYPNLKLVSVESGVGWIPYLMEGLEYQLDEFAGDECKDLQRRPREYFRDHIYSCFWFEDYGPRAVIETIGVNNVLFETDFPHPTCLYPRAAEHIADVLSGLSEHARQRVLQDNAAELYNIPLPAAPAS